MGMKQRIRLNEKKDGLEWLEQIKDMVELVKKEILEK